MKDALNIVRGAVSDKDLIPVLTFYHIYDGRVQGYNGRVAIDTACDAFKGMNVTVQAEKFWKAVAVPGFSGITQHENHIVVQCGRARMKVPSIPNDQYPKMNLQTADVTAGPCPDNLVTALRAVHAFVGSDASRPWSRGVLLHENHVYATNNVVLVRYPIAWPYSAISLPSEAVDELLRLGENPTSVRMNDKAIVFIYNGCVTWLRAQLQLDPWPHLEPFFDHDFASLPDVPEGLEDAVVTVSAFCPDLAKTIRFGPQGVSTREGEYSAEVDGYVLTTAAYNAEKLLSALHHADKFAARGYPAPSLFSRKDGLQGVMAGIRE